MELSYRETQYQHWNTARLNKSVILGMIESLGLKPKDVWDGGDQPKLEEAMPQGRRPNNFWTFCNDVKYYHTTLRTSRHALSHVPSASFHVRHQSQSISVAREVFASNFKKNTTTPVVEKLSHFNELLRDDGIDLNRDEEDMDRSWTTSDKSRLFVTTSYHKHVEDMGLKEWVPVGGKKMMFVHSIERRRPAWAEEQGIQVRKAIMMETARINLGYRSYSDVYRYHNNVWLLTMKAHDGSVLAAANKDFGKARSLMEQYVKTNVLDRLDF